MSDPVLFVPHADLERRYPVNSELSDLYPGFHQSFSLFAIVLISLFWFFIGFIYFIFDTVRVRTVLSSKSDPI